MSRAGKSTERLSASTRITPDNWSAARAALADTRDRFEELITGVDPLAMATDDWTVMDTAAHVAVNAWLDAAIVQSDDRVQLPARPGLGTLVLGTTVDNIHHGLNARMLRDYAERDPAVVLSKLRGCVDDLLRLTAADDPARTVGWLGGSRVPLAGLVAHLTNELLVHGRDIAHRTATPWRMPEQDAARFFELFVVEITRNGVGGVLDNDRPPYPGRIAVEFRSAQTAPVTIVLESGELSAEEPSRDNDMRIYFKPTALSLVLFHRVARLRAAMTGELRIWGRRPWLLMPFFQKVRLP